MQTRGKHCSDWVQVGWELHVGSFLATQEFQQQQQQQNVVKISNAMDK